jgi:serine/threonine-protein kinase
MFVLRSVAVALLVSALPMGAHAQSSASDKAAAEALFDEGKKLMIQGQYATACSRLEQSQRIDPGIGTLLYLAECYEKGGRTASAWATFREAASSARAAGQLDRARMGQQRADRLEAGLSKLTVNVAPENAEIAGFEVRRGDQPVPRPLWNIPVPVDPGDQAIEARAPGRKPFSATVRVGEQAARASVSVPVLEVDPTSAAPEAAAAAPAPAAAAPPASSAPAALPAADEETSQGLDRRTIGLIVGGAGIVGLGIGTVFGLRAIGKNSDAEEYCPDGDRCFPQAESLTNEARNAATVANVAFGLGAAALIGGGILYFTAPSKAEARRLRLAPIASSRGGAVLVQGAF